jgi:hypothetical protein
MKNAHEEWLKAHQLEMKKADEEFEVAYQGARRALDEFGGAIDSLKRYNSIGACVLGMYSAMLFAYVVTDT